MCFNTILGSWVISAGVWLCLAAARTRAPAACNPCGVRAQVLFASCRSRVSLLAPVGSRDQTGYGRVSAQRDAFRVTSALPEPDSLLTHMALLLSGAVAADEPAPRRPGIGQ